MLAIWLGTIYQQGILILLTLCLDDNCKLTLSSSQNSPVLVTLTLLPAWLLANQRFIKNNISDRVQDHCPTARVDPHFYILIKLIHPTIMEAPIHDICPLLSLIWVTFCYAQ